MQIQEEKQALGTNLDQFTAAKCNDSLADMPELREPAWLPTVLFYIVVNKSISAKSDCILLMTIQALCT